MEFLYKGIEIFIIKNSRSRLQYCCNFAYPDEVIVECAARNYAASFEVSLGERCYYVYNLSLWYRQRISIFISQNRMLWGDDGAVISTVPVKVADIIHHITMQRYQQLSFASLDYEGSNWVFMTKPVIKKMLQEVMPNLGLTVIDYFYLKLFALNCTCETIASLMNRSGRTVEGKARKLMRKFSCSNKKELVEICKLF